MLYSKENLKKLITTSDSVNTLKENQKRVILSIYKSSKLAPKRELFSILYLEKTDESKGKKKTVSELHKFLESLNVRSTKTIKTTTKVVSVSELRKTALSLLKSFLFFSPEEINERVKKVKYLPQEGLQKLIKVLEEGHEKQKHYLQIFAEKDPNLIYKLNLLINKAKINHK